MVSMMKMIEDIMKTILMRDNIQGYKYDELNLMMLTKIKRKILILLYRHQGEKSGSQWILGSAFSPLITIVSLIC
jgi:hypothetical protein